MHLFLPELLNIFFLLRVGRIIIRIIKLKWSNRIIERKHRCDICSVLSLKSESLE